MRFYRIMRLSDGLFSTGGEEPQWTKQGKFWSRLSHLLNHVNHVAPEDYYLVGEVVVVTYNLCEIGRYATIVDAKAAESHNGRGN
jgi:hypothetical protein